MDPAVGRNDKPNVAKMHNKEYQSCGWLNKATRHGFRSHLRAHKDAGEYF